MSKESDKDKKKKKKKNKSAETVEVKSTITERLGAPSTAKVLME